MSRIIKFRAWGTEEKGYVIPTFYISPSTGIMWGSYTGIKLPKENYILEQFTGLLDKNGKEIYEGDYVTVIPKPDANGYFHHISSVNGCSLKTRIVIWLNDEAQFGWRLINGVIEGSGFSLCKSNAASIFEIIGNIHEHPEIMEGEDG